MLRRIRYWLERDRALKALAAVPPTQACLGEPRVECVDVIVANHAISRIRR
jgi:hypothetical protein